MDAILLAQLDAFDAQIGLLQVQAVGLRHRLVAIAEAERTLPQATIALPERCAAHESRVCALQNDDALIRIGSFRNPTAWQCHACGHKDV